MSFMTLASGMLISTVKQNGICNKVYSSEMEGILLLKSILHNIYASILLPSIIYKYTIVRN